MRKTRTDRAQTYGWYTRRVGSDSNSEQQEVMPDDLHGKEVEFACSYI